MNIVYVNKKGRQTPAFIIFVEDFI